MFEMFASGLPDSVLFSVVNCKFDWMKQRTQEALCFRQSKRYLISGCMKLYLDTSALKRPFDDQSQPRIALETEAIVTVLAMIQGREADLLTSSVLEYENSRNPQTERRRWTSQVFTHKSCAWHEQSAVLRVRRNNVRRFWNPRG